MKSTLKFATLIIALLVLSCGGVEEKKETSTVKLKKQSTEKKAVTNITKASETVDLTSKGVGPITSIEIHSQIDQAMVTHGKDVFDKMCTACHRVGKKFIGPAPDGIMDRRTPEWVMNMILDPEGMVKNDPLARELLIEFNGSPMANQNISKDDARALIEYFRTLK